jgi:hypothetical protein
MGFFSYQAIIKDADLQHQRYSEIRKEKRENRKKGSRWKATSIGQSA